MGQTLSSLRGTVWESSRRQVQRRPPDVYRPRSRGRHAEGEIDRLDGPCYFPSSSLWPARVSLPFQDADRPSRRPWDYVVEAMLTCAGRAAIGGPSTWWIQPWGCALLPSSSRTTQRRSRSSDTRGRRCHVALPASRRWLVPGAGIEYRLPLTSCAATKTEQANRHKACDVPHSRYKSIGCLLLAKEQRVKAKERVEDTLE